MFYLTNSIHSQSYLWKDNGSGGNGHSIVYEFLDGNGISKIGIGTENPSAKFHLQATPTTSSPTAKFDWISTGSTVLGSIEHWHFNGGTMYYGIYQPQPQPSSGTTVKNYLYSNLGIGVVDPFNKLDVNGIIGCTGADATGVKIDNTGLPFVFQYLIPGGSGSGEQDSDPIEGGNETLSPLTITRYGITVQTCLTTSNINTNGITTPNMTITNNPSVGSVLWCGNSTGATFWTDPSVFKISNGKVSIGTTNTYDDYKLAVNGNVICQELKIKLYGQWPDYVFSKDYKLPSLKEVDQFIHTNKHLPDMPSAKEVKDDGVNLGEMNARLTKKVEELTLYLISLQKEMDQLKAKIATR